MNHIVEEMLMHYGMPRRSGRYPWGSGEDPYQHAKDFLGRIEEKRKSNFTYTDPKTGKTYTGDTAIAKEMGLSTTQLRTEIGIARSERRMYDVARAKSMSADGKTPTEIGREMGVRESTVRSWLDAKSEERMNKAKEIAETIKARSKEFEASDGMGMIDVGSGVEHELNISREKLNQALYLLEREGYGVYSGRIEQVTNRGNFTTQMVLCPPHIQPREGAKAPKEIYELDKIHTLKDYISRDGGETLEKKFTYPESMDSKRLQIRYSEEGGLEKDGIVEIRRGVPDLSLGESRYSQVRILVDGTHYIKGMAVYSDDLPDGVDVMFNTNKKAGTPMTDVLKGIKKDPDNPFGSAIKDAEQGGQYWYDPKTGEKVSSKTPGAKLGLINKRADEGDWTEWKDKLPSQFLSKQSRYMAKKQLDLAKADKMDEFDEICSLTNPTVKKHLLQKFADECDSAAVHLQAAALPGQKYHVIIPINTLKDSEVYAPQYENGTKLALIRYPHGGTFEIPIVTVNNKNALAKDIIGTKSIDAVGINKNVADRLSGADFDGDTVMCIPTHDKEGKVRITSTRELDGLKGFDAKEKYGNPDKVVTGPDGKDYCYKGDVVYKRMTKRGTQTQMGIISNLITDMTLANAKEEELAAAVRHSMVVIDAEKHKLNYKQSEIDNNIAALHKKYQGKSTGGAATIISKAKGETSVDKRQGTPKINQKGKEWYDPSKPEGALIFKTADDATYQVTKTNKRTGEVTVETRVRQQKITKMEKADDAYELVSDARHPMEVIYADYANDMKSLANRARMEMVTTGKVTYNKAAKLTYEAEVRKLTTDLNIAELNKTRERAAQRMSNVEIDKKLKSGQLEKSDVKKASQRAISKYRDEVGAVARKNRNIEISDRQWEAIQAGAVSESILKRVLNNTDTDRLRELATPRSTSSLSNAKVSRIKALSASNYTVGEIAKKLGVSTSVVSKYLKGKE